MCTRALSLICKSERAALVLEGVNKLICTISSLNINSLIIIYKKHYLSNNKFYFERKISKYSILKKKKLRERE